MPASERRKNRQLFLFSIEDHRYALHLDAVEKVVRMVEVTPLPEGPQIVLGVVNLQGRVIPVIDLRKRFHLAQREPSAADYLLIARAAERTVALWVDTVAGLAPNTRDGMTRAAVMTPDLQFVEGAVKIADGIILVIDLDAFLALEGSHQIDRAVDSLSASREVVTAGEEIHAE